MTYHPLNSSEYIALTLNQVLNNEADPDRGGTYKNTLHRWDVFRAVCHRLAPALPPEIEWEILLDPEGVPTYLLDTITIDYTNDFDEGRILIQVEDDELNILVEKSATRLINLHLNIEDVEHLEYEDVFNNLDLFAGYVE